MICTSSEPRPESYPSRALEMAIISISIDFDMTIFLIICNLISRALQNFRFLDCFGHRRYPFQLQVSRAMVSYVRTPSTPPFFSLSNLVFRSVWPVLFLTSTLIRVSGFGSKVSICLHYFLRLCLSLRLLVSGLSVYRQWGIYSCSIFNDLDTYLNMTDVHPQSPRYEIVIRKAGERIHPYSNKHLSLTIYSLPIAPLLLKIKQSPILQ